MRLCSTRTGRSAVTTVEGAVIFLVLLVLVLGVLDLIIRSYRQDILSMSAHHATRQAMVRGSKSDQLGSWGPTTVGPIKASDSDPIAKAVRQRLVGIEPSSVSIKAVWLDGTNDPGNRVEITVSATYQPIIPFLFGSSVTLEGKSIQFISH